MNTTDWDGLTQWNNELAQIYIANDVFLIIYIILGAVGNAVVIIIYNFRMRKKDDRYFIPYLAILDLFACVFRSSLELSMNLNPVTFKGSIVCKLVWFPTNVFAIASIFLLVVIALHRYLKICRPFGTQMTLLKKRIALCMCVVIAFSFAVPLVVYNEEMKVINPTTNVTGYICDIDVDRYYGTGFLVYLIITTLSSLMIMLFLATCNILIGRRIYQQIKAKHLRNRCQNMTSLTPLVVPRNDINVSENIFGSEKNLPSSNTLCNTVDVGNTKSGQISCSHRYSLMFMAIALAFIVSYGPRFVILAISLYDPKFFGKLSAFELSLVAFSREMNVVNNVVNPFIYGFFDRTFRKETKKLFCR